MSNPADSGAARPRQADGPVRADSVSRSAYISRAEARLAETKRKLEEIGDRVEKVGKAKIQVGTHLATIERRLNRLKQSGAASGKDLRRSIDKAWDDLAAAIKNIVDRLA